MNYEAQICKGLEKHKTDSYEIATYRVNLFSFNFTELSEAV